MQTSLFDNPTLKQQITNKTPQLTEAKIIQPLTQVLEEVTTRPVGEQSQPLNNSQSIKQSLDELFPEQQYDEKNLKKTKDILGDVAGEYSDMELQGIAVEIRYLAESWLDNFEQGIFGGLTLKEVLHEKGGGR